MDPEGTGSPAVERRCGPAGGVRSEGIRGRNPREESKPHTPSRRAAGLEACREEFRGQLRVVKFRTVPVLSPDCPAGQGPKRRGAGGGNTPGLD